MDGNRRLGTMEFTLLGKGDKRSNPIAIPFSRFDKNPNPRTRAMGQMNQAGTPRLSVEMTGVFTISTSSPVLIGTPFYSLNKIAGD